MVFSPDECNNLHRRKCRKHMWQAQTPVQGGDLLSLKVIQEAITMEVQVLLEDFGPVVTDQTKPEFIGADVGSNNTAELSANLLCYA